MELIRQVLSDTRKAIRSIIIFGIVTIVSWIFMVWTFADFITVVSENRYISALKKDNVEYLVVDSFDSVYSPDPYHMDGSYGRFDSSAFLNDCLSSGGNAGALFELGDNEYTSFDVVLILGIYNDYLVDAEIPDSGVVFIGTKDLYEQRKGKIRINADKYDMLPVSRVPDVFYPQGIFKSGSSMKNTLFVCSRDYRAVRKLFPWIETYDPDGLAMLDRMIFRNLPDDENIRLRRSVLEQTGKYAQIISCSEYYSRNQLSNVRQTLAYVVFYLLAFIVLPVSMAVNNYSNIMNNARSYLTHRMFGATLRHTFIRMLLLSLNYYVLPVTASLIFFAGSQYSKTVLWSIPFALAGAFIAAASAYGSMRADLINGKGDAE